MSDAHRIAASWSTTLSEEIAKHQADLSATYAEMERETEELGRELGERRREQVAREERALELSQGILDTQRALLAAQQALVDEQVRQAADAAIDRRVQHVVLAVAVLALLAGVAAPVAAGTGSPWWTLLAAVSTAVVTYVVAKIIMRERQARADSRSPG